LTYITIFYILNIKKSKKSREGFGIIINFLFYYIN